MGNQIYTVITFAPVQGFIEKSRKLRDLYGSSYLLSLLSWAIGQAAESQDYEVVSPALPNITQGMPNQIIIKGDITEEGVEKIKKRFYEVWKAVADSCREWIEYNVTKWEYKWKREWNLWSHHAWEFFWAIGEPGERITDVRERINQEKTSRDWTGINWQGESSTLSGADAIAYPNIGATGDPQKYSYQSEQRKIREFYEQLSLKLKGDQSSEEEGSPFINVREELSIPELIKRLITHGKILDKFKDKLIELEKEWKNDLVVQKKRKKIYSIANELRPRSFKDLNRHKDEKDEKKYWTGWFQGDGDSASKYFKSLREDEEEAKTTAFSEEMRKWGKWLIDNQKEKLPKDGRMIYAGGDDFLGVIYENNKQINAVECLRWFYTFKSEIWGHKPEPEAEQEEGKNKEKTITASVGFVWAGAQVPQRDVLQHCHEAEQSAKKKGRDRISFRILFNSGNHLEWVCPWWVLDEEEIKKLSEKFPTPEQNLIKSYKSRSKDDNWTHFYQDVGMLESRHAFGSEKTKFNGEWIKTDRIDIALGLIEIYFGSGWKDIIANAKNWWNLYDKDDLQTFTGILGDPKSFKSDSSDRKTPEKALNDWVINLAKVGFHLTEGDRK